jgi:electron transfer flavoprotein alpha subunit
MNALVFIEFNGSEIKKSSLEALSAVKSGNNTIMTCAVGAGSDQLASQLGAWGSTKHFSCTDEKANTYNPEVYQTFLSKVFEDASPQLVVASSNNVGRDVFPRLAAKFDMAYMSDITEMEAGDSLSVKRPMYAGKCSAQVTFTDESGKIILLRPNQIPVVAADGAGSPEAVSISLDSTPGQSETVSVEQGESEKLDLTEAETIVSGGRGLKEADNFKLLHDLADPLNATVGASRAVVDLGWVPHSLQVGQTGKTVAPNLYFAVGISGAIQHLAGMSGSKNIVAINKDEKAPIFQKATYGIVGDLFEVVPKLTEKLKSL